MTKTAATAQKLETSQSAATVKTTMTVSKPDPKPASQPETPREPTLQERIHRVQTLSLIVEKRDKLVETRNLLEKFQVASNDFNCTLRVNDSDGNVFSTSFTPGIKKVIEFLKASFDASITEVEAKIRF